MCGICGFAYKDAATPVDSVRLTKMRDVMTYRGPDDAGSYLGQGAALGSRRLAVLDLSERGHMPMASRDGRYHIAYNGEVYNFREIREDLERKGHVFTSGTDTEVVLYGYIEYGPAILDRLDGMFGIAIWDSRDRRLFLARDHAGIKPVYYYEDAHGLYFGSEQKVLFAGGVPLACDPEMWEELLCFGYTAGERTPFKGVKRLPAGHYLFWDKDRTTVTRWWNLSERARKLRDRIPKDPVEWLRDTFDRSVKYRLISDVPVGVLLSGGLDSTSVAASIAELTNAGKLSSFTVRFAEDGYDESAIARGSAEKWGLDYHDLYVDPKDLLPKLRQASWINDEPLLHASTPHLLAISEYAKPRVTVLLSGEGSDEILGGYDRHLIMNPPFMMRAAKYLPAQAGRLSHKIKKLQRFSSLKKIEDVPLYNSCEIFPRELASIGAKDRGQFPEREKIAAEARALYPGDYFRQSLYYDQHTFLGSILDRNDRMTMGASIECRVPFLDSHLMETAAAMPTSTLFSFKEGKHLLRKAVGDRLPQAVLRHKKWGFGVPWPKYLRSQPALMERLLEVPRLEPVRSILSADPKSVSSMIEAFLKGETRHEKIIYRLFMISIWYEEYFPRFS